MTCNKIDNYIINANSITSLSTSRPPVPNFLLLNEDFQEMLTTFADLQKNLTAYLKNPDGKNASKELTNIQYNMGILATLFNPENKNGFFGAANNNPAALEIINNLDGDIQSMIDLTNNGSLSSLASVLNLLSSPSLQNNLANLYSIIYG